MHLEATPRGVETSVGLAQVWSQLANLMMQLHDMAKVKVVCEHIWCTTYHSKRHRRYEFPALPNYVAMGAPSPFPFGQMKWCEICKQWGHMPPHCHTLQKYQTTNHTPFCKLWKSIGHDVNSYRSLMLMQDNTRDAIRVHDENKGGENSSVERGGYQGGTRGGHGHDHVCKYGGGGGRPSTCFNCNEIVHVSQLCTKPLILCAYCYSHENVTEDYHDLLKK